jgi:hypothetical protein
VAYIRAGLWSDRVGVITGCVVVSNTLLGQLPVSIASASAMCENVRILRRLLPRGTYMLAFEIAVNGKRVCIAGTSKSKVVATTVTWTYRHPEQVSFSIGGIPDDDSANHMAWTAPLINVGDEVCIRLIDTNSCDAPDSVYDPRITHDHDSGT